MTLAGHFICESSMSVTVTEEWKPSVSPYCLLCRLLGVSYMVLRVTFVETVGQRHQFAQVSQSLLVWAA